MTSFLSDEEKAETAFELLSCSAMSRYLRIVRLLCERYQLGARVVADRRFAGEHAQRLWREVQASSHREPAEFELALLLLASVDVGLAPGVALLGEIAASDHIGATWLAALAARLQRSLSPRRAWIDSPGHWNIIGAHRQLMDLPCT